MDGNGLRLVGGDADTVLGFGSEPPAPIPFKQYAKRYPHLTNRRNSHIELEGHPLPFPLPGGRNVDEFFDSISRRIEDLAHALGLDDDDDDTDRPRAA